MQKKFQGRDNCLANDEMNAWQDVLNQIDMKYQNLLPRD